jgi:hypothetical protein
MLIGTDVDPKPLSLMIEGLLWWTAILNSSHKHLIGNNENLY